MSALWRYPVKSMQGELLDESEVVERGLLGDRAFALLDVETGRVASAKSPRLWPNLLDFRAVFVHPPSSCQPLPPVQITIPNGGAVSTDDPDVEKVLSDATGRTIRLATSNPDGASYEQYVPPIEGADPAGEDFYRDFPNDMFGTGSLHDASPIHLLTTATLDRLAGFYPEGQFDVRRFRPNVVVETDATESGFVENDWVKKHITVGEVEVRVTVPMPRCVMTTRPQGDLPKDLGILRTTAERNRLEVLNWPGTHPCVGVAGLIRSTGTIRTGDLVELKP